jgi:hypothetical protein
MHCASAKPQGGTIRASSGYRSMEDPVIARRLWAIPEGHIPGRRFSGQPELVSREVACISSAADRLGLPTIFLILGELARLGAAAAGGFVFFVAGAVFAATRRGDRRGLSA